MVVLCPTHLMVLGFLQGRLVLGFFFFFSFFLPLLLPFYISFFRVAFLNRGYQLLIVH